MRKKILIVDDEEDFATLSALRIGEAGFEVHIETDGGKAFQRIQELNPDAVLLDIMLQTDDGLSLLKKIKKEMPQVIVIVITGKAMLMGDIFKMEGAAAFFKKPIDVKELVKKIQELTQ
ncbi:MAG: response regulator [Candidatus Omnitrophica bacterium]|nr:response regulator [Candidatus Omnitrophota bacterium]